MGNFFDKFDDPHKQPHCARCGNLCKVSTDHSGHYWEKYCKNCKCSARDCHHHAKYGECVCTQHHDRYYIQQIEEEKQRALDWYYAHDNMYGYDNGFKFSYESSL